MLKQPSPPAYSNVALGVGNRSIMQPILKINLTTGQTEEYRIPEQWEKDFLGGASLAARILYASLTRELDPLSPAAPLLFMMGPMTGTSGPTTGRFVVW